MKQKKVLITLAVFLLFGLIIGAVALYFRFLAARIIVASPESSFRFPTSITPTPSPDPLRSYNILLLGYGGAGHDGSSLTDTMIIARVSPQNKKVTLISIPRDLWVKLPISPAEAVEAKINAAYAIGNDDRHYPGKTIDYSGPAGGGNLAKYAVSQVTGLEMEYFFAIDFAGFEQSINILGGVEINLPYAFEDKYYPVKGMEDESCGHSDEEIDSLTATLSGQLLDEQFPCRYEILNFPAGKQTLDGITALKFVRSRHSQNYGGDFYRGQRQQILLNAVKDKALRVGIIPKIIPLLSQLSNHLRTDMPMARISEIIGNHGQLGDYHIDTITISIDNVLKESRSLDRQYILTSTAGIHNWQPVHDFLSQQLTELKNQ